MNKACSGYAANRRLSAAGYGMTFVLRESSGFDATREEGEMITRLTRRSFLGDAVVDRLRAMAVQPWFNLGNAWGGENAGLVGFVPRLSFGGAENGAGRWRLRFSPPQACGSWPSPACELRGGSIDLRFPSPDPRQPESPTRCSARNGLGGGRFKTNVPRAPPGRALSGRDARGEFTRAGCE